MPERYDLECMGEDVEMIVGDDGAVTFEGWDEEAEDAWIAIGGDPSPCWIVARALEEGKLDEELFEQIKHGHTAIVNMLIAVGSDIEAVDESRWTPLHLASFNGSADIAALLIENEANIGAKDGDEWEPLHWCSFFGYLDVVDMLLDAGANPSARTDTDTTPLHHAAMEDHEEVVSLLLEAGSDLSARDVSGWTPLMYAEQQGNDAIVDLLDRWIAEH